MARSAVNPNVDSPVQEHTRRAEWSGVAEENEREGTRDEARATAEALDENLTMREADSRREVPRLRTDAANPNMSRNLPSASATRGMLSSNRQKDYNKAKVAWAESMPKTRRDAIARTARNREQLEDLNRDLNSVTGMRSQLPAPTRRRAERLDAAISDFERTNQREHVVYSTLQAPYDRQPSRDALRRRLTTMSEEGGSMTFDSYIPATHSLGNVQDSNDVVMEIKTRSGAYLGSSDTTPNSNHIVGRGRTLRPVGVHDVSYTQPDGSRGTRTVVQMEDVTQETRTEASD